jgi:NAD(P)-dependent dehydrogenase (short-subunit alcohol dehydrogenase family)
MNGKTVLVTGASSGMGHETAKVLLGLGYTVYTAARRVEKMDDLKGLGAIPLRMDITKEEDIVSAVEKIAQESGGVDVLINNAGFGMYGAMEDTALDDARYQFEVNLFGLALLTQLVLPHMRDKRWGKIVNISSMGGKIYTPLGSWYHATKHALEGWSDCLRFELAPFGIDVIIVEPGAIETEFGDVMIGPMMERSGNTAYSEMARAVEKTTRDAYEKGGGSPPSVIANIIAKAIRVGKPGTRYAAGRMAKPTMFIRKWFGDRAFDSMLRRMMK